MSAAIQSDSEVGSEVKMSSSAPSPAPRPSNACSLKLAHQKICIKQEDDETDFCNRSPDILLHF